VRRRPPAPPMQIPMENPMTKSIPSLFAPQIAVDGEFLDHLLARIADLATSQSCACVAERLRPLADDLEGIAEGRAPGEEILARAPVLFKWTFFADPGGLRLMGVVAGHPSARPGPILTSMLYAIDPELRWARTLSRFYRLGDFSRPPIPNASGPH